MSAPRRLALLLAYDGRGFHGFQRQAGFPSVQEELERAWSAVTGERAVVHGSGRTDTGVHAWGQVAHLDTVAKLPVERVAPALNAYLPNEVVVRAAAAAAPQFHARASAIGKRYVYLLAVGSQRPLLRAGWVGWERAASLDLAAMRAGARHLLGRQDFSAFAAAGRTSRTSVRTLRCAHLRRVRGGLMLAFEADGFLYKQVRNMVGALQEVGRGRRAPEWIAALLASGDRRKAAATAPAVGLYLWRVRYAADPFAGRCRH
ncbi:MAG: tRNA pseudouridine(38-40) synthase TruA [Planctomycetota bacterium]|nr:MAG: tRNA pseudouridine(38-40) synthase TruA [Planctomycetota bacterium]